MKANKLLVKKLEITKNEIDILISIFLTKIFII